MNTDHQRRISNWLESRQQLLVFIFEIQQMPVTSLDLKSNQTIIKSFCESLIDYVSAGHFEIYHKMMEALDGQSSMSIEQAHTLLNGIQHSTDLAVAFDHQYDFSKTNRLDQLFRKRLSDLAESLAERFEIEDILFNQFSSGIARASA